MDRAAIEQATLTMLRRLADADDDHAHERNAVGFNGRDTEFGNDLAQKARLSDRQLTAALGLLRTYSRTQLAGCGFDDVAQAWETCDPTPVRSEQPRARFAVNCDLCNGRIAVDTPITFTSTRRPCHVACPTQAETAVALLYNEPMADPPRGSAVSVLGPGGAIARSLPGYEVRPEQLQLTEAIERALFGGTNLVAEGPTGVGKSLAYLVPTILQCVQRGERAIISTGDKALQDQIVNLDIPFLQEHMGVPFRHAILKGRSNYACLQAMEELRGADAAFPTQAAANAWPDFLGWLDETPTGDLEAYPGGLDGGLRSAASVGTDACTGKKCPFYNDCFVERAKAAAQAAHIVVVNHSLLLRDLQVRFSTDGYASVLPDADIVILDEAHNLESVATEAFDTEVTLGRWGIVEGGIRRLTSDHPAVKQGDLSEGTAAAAHNAELAHAIGAALGAYVARVSERMGKDNTMRLGDELDALHGVLDPLAQLAVTMAEEQPSYLDGHQRETWGRFRKMVLSLRAALERVATPGSPDWVRYAEAEAATAGGRRISLHCKPIDVAGALRDRLWNAPLRRTIKDQVNDAAPPTVVCVSATIAAQGRFDYFRRQVGLDNASECIVESPFDFARNGLLYVPAEAEAFDSSLARKGQTMGAYFDRLAQRVSDLLLVSRGRAFVLFTSFSALGQVWDRMPQRLRDTYTFMRQGEHNLSRPELVARFKADGNAVLFGTKSFWEGVDCPGEALSLVIVDKFPFPPPDDVVWAARAERVKARGGNDFAQLMVPYATIQLKQGVGRLIRRKDDRGVVAILDTRIQTKPYGRGIVGSLPPMRRTNKLEDVRGFFS